MDQSKLDEHFKGITKQSAFNRAWEEVHNKGFSIGEGHDVCTNEAPNGARCAVACQFHSEFDVKAWQNSTLIDALIYATGISPPFWDMLRTIHDSSALNNLETYESDMRLFASRHGLEVPK